MTSLSDQWCLIEDRDTPKKVFTAMGECEHLIPFDSICLECSKEMEDWVEISISFSSVPSPSEDRVNPYLKEFFYDKIDIYRVLDVFEVKDHAIGHAVKKLLCAGKRGAKSKRQDIQEAIDALERWKEMEWE